MADILFHPEAQAEYDGALAWYLARSPRAASRYETALERILRSIGDNPESYPSYDDDHRFAVVKRFPFSVVYRVEMGHVYVIAVAHSSRAPGYWQGRA